MLTGSLARQEETAAARAKGTTLRSDVECLALLHRGHARPSPAAVRELCRDIEQKLAERGVHCRVGISVVYADYLRRLPPHIFSYELRTCGEVLWGEPTILNLIPPMNAAQIDREDAWRTLSNRMIEQLEALGSCESRESREALHYRSVKLCLDIATSVLVFKGQYEAGYAERARRFEALAKTGDDAGLPFAAAEFVRHLRACTAEKLNSSLSALRPSEAFAREIGRFAQQAWLWELREMLGVPGEDATTLVRQFAARQGFAARLRGWAYCLPQRLGTFIFAVAALDAAGGAILTAVRHLSCGIPAAAAVAAGRRWWCAGRRGTAASCGPAAAA